jgi:hypothetical protein
MDACCSGGAEMTGYKSKKAAAQDKMAQPAQDPVDDIRGFLAARLTCWHRLTEKESDELVALFEVKPPQRPWVGLTDEEAQWLYDNCRTPSNLIEMAEARLKQKNT